MFEQTVKETCFFLPEDGGTARDTFLSLLHSPGETWISAFGCTDPDLLAEIAKADSNGIPVHIMLDHTQFSGPTEKPLIEALAKTMQHGDITITTAGADSHRTSTIYHWKTMVVDALDGGEPFVWRGSVNWSGDGWNQGNEASTFRSAIFAGEFLKVFDIHQTWARQHEPQYQIMLLPTHPGDLESQHQE